MTFRSLTLGLLASASLCAAAQAADIEHVLLISIDGLHALDVAHFVESHPNSTLAALAEHGATFTNARTPSLSDSFPGLLALVTGGSPISHGMFYDVSYDRTLFAPSNTACTGAAGNMMVFDESIDKYNANHVSADVIDPAALPHRLDEDKKCVAVYPHNAIKTNTIFEAVKSKGGLTAWADKHPAYDLVNGLSGKGVDDLYAPEITNVGGFDATVSVDCTVANDMLKATAILNQIKGLRHDGSPGQGTPALFGMNFQAVSVAQKMAKDNRDGSCPSSTHTGQVGGYLDGAGTPSPLLAFGLEKTDAALGQMVAGLKARGLYNSTLFIVSAKHGQAPINPLKLNKPGHFADLVAALPGAAANPGAQAIIDAGACSTGPCGFVQDDDVALIWLKDQTETKAAIDYLNANVKALFIDEVIGGDDLALKFNSPKHDSRTPDIIVQPAYGTIYTTSGKKIEEHGGMSFADTNVGLIVANPRFPASIVKTPVATSQVAPTILKALEIDPDVLKAVRQEHTGILPGLWTHERE